MSCDNKSHSPVRNVVRAFLALLLTGTLLLGTSAAFAVDSGDIVVVSAKGEVHITTNGTERKVRAGGVLELPATVRTGRDGAVEIKQGATTVSVGPDTLLDFPALEKRGAPIDRIVQPQGNAFYDIGKREGRKLRVETPYLVGVIKGTQFNVAVQEDAATISLFEGLLEVRAADDSDIVDLKAGEIASRKRGDKSISILKMDAGKAPTGGARPSPGTDPAPDGGTSGSTIPRVTPSNEGGESLLVDRAPINVRADVDVNTDLRNGALVDAGTSASIGLGDMADVNAKAEVNVGASGAEVVTTVGLDTGPASVDLGVAATVNAAAGTVDVSTGVAVDAGPVTVDLDTSAAVDLTAGSVDATASTTVDAGPVTVDLDTTAAVDLGAGAVDVTADTTIDAGPVTTDVAADTAVDLSAASVDTSVDLGVATPVADVDLGAAAAVDVSNGTVDLGVDVAGTDVDVGLGVADVVDTVDTVTDSVTDTVTDTVTDVGGLLNGLIRPGRK
jgi:hypothetical protein